MTDKLRKAAQDVLDYTTGATLDALREALQAEPEKPVAWICSGDLRGMPYKIVGCKVFCRNEEHFDTPLYTTPPSVDALIAEIDYMPMPIDGVRLNAILDKYRSKP